MIDPIAAAYMKHGWSLVPIPLGTKGPRTTGWNLKASALRIDDRTPIEGIGLAHAYSGTMALDIDDWGATATALAVAGINLQDLYDAPDAVAIESGNPCHGKLIYSMPGGLTLPSKKIIIGGKTIYELRCATSNGLTVQDVLPPSIHPTTHSPYKWAGSGDWTRTPRIPQKLLEVWEQLLKSDTSRCMHSGDSEESSDMSWSDIESALDSIPAGLPRSEWIAVGMALKWAAEQAKDEGRFFAAWDTWSKTSDKYPGDREMVGQWSSFKNDKGTIVKLGSLFHIAEKYGWVRPAVDVSLMFTAVTPAAPDSPLLDLSPRPPTMDLSLWPAVLARRATEVGTTVGCDPLIPLFAGLGAVCAVVDARSRLELIKDFKVPPVLWLMTIGAPADRKSPGSSPMLMPLKGIEAEDVPRYKSELLSWEGKEARYSVNKKAFLDFAASPESLMDPSQAPEVPDLPTPPVPLRLTVDDVTSQKLVRIVADRPRGVLCALDEMNSWVGKLVDKKSGEDRSAWVRSYESAPYSMDRVGTGSIFAENMAVSIYGNIQPRVFRESLDSLSADGLIQRFAPVIVNPELTKKPIEIPDYLLNKGQWENTLRLVYAMPPTNYKLSPEAKEVFQSFQDWYIEQRRNELYLQSDDTFMTAFGKIEGLAGRFMLMFHVIESPFSPTVSKDLAERVVKIVQSYLVPAFRYALTEFSPHSSFEKWLRDYIIQYATDPTITLRQIKRSARRQIGQLNTWQQDQLILNAIYAFELGGWVSRVDDGTGEVRHYAEWAINPKIATQFADHRKQVKQAKQAQLDYIYRDSPKPKPKVKWTDLEGE